MLTKLLGKKIWDPRPVISGFLRKALYPKPRRKARVRGAVPYGAHRQPQSNVDMHQLTFGHDYKEAGGQGGFLTQRRIARCKADVQRSALRSAVYYWEHKRRQAAVLPGETRRCMESVAPNDRLGLRHV